VRRKLSKLRSISAAAQQSSSGVIVDTEALEEPVDSGEGSDEAAASISFGGAAATVGQLATGASDAAERRGPGQAAYSSAGEPAATKGTSPVSSRRVRFDAGSSGTSLLGGGGGGAAEGSDSELTVGSNASGSGAASTSRIGGSGAAATSGGPNVSSGPRSRSGSRRGSGEQQQPPRIPIWERSTPSTPTRERPAAAASKVVMQPVAVKTFQLSPSVGSLGGALARVM